MSLTSALTNAASGLSASARAVQVASSNVANALTEGYAARQIDLTASTLGGVGSGVRVAGVTRLVDPALLSATRLSQGQAQAGSTDARFWQSVEALIGQPGQGVSAALSALENALISSTERPDLDNRLQSVADAATGLAQTLGTVETGIQALRAEADAAIGRDVQALNSGLTRVDELNARIVALNAAGQSTLGLQDERQALVSSLSEIVPLREFARPDGRVTLYSGAGRLLLDINPQEIGFAPANAMDASLSSASGLSGLTIGGIDAQTGPGGPLAGGRLAANFALRDTQGPEIQSRLDALAADLVGRFAASATDPTLTASQPGLFTDAGSALAAAPAPGLAGRIAVNPLVLPDQGGALWRLRDGLGAAAPGPVGDATGIRNLVGALDRSLSAGPGSPAQSFAQNLANTSTYVSRLRQGAEDSATQSASHLSELTQQSLAQGVDTDAEMQRLLSIERAYAANARVIQVADTMLQRLLEI